MKYSTFVKLWVVFGLGIPGFAQSGAVIPQGGVGHAERASCVILKRMGPADQVTSRFYSFGIRGKQFQYVEGKLPEGFPFHGRLTDHDVRNLQGRGVEVVVVEAHYTADDLMNARADCRGETGTTPNQTEAKAAPTQPPIAGEVLSARSLSGTSIDVPSSAPSAPARLSIASEPLSADIEVDGSFVGNTPSDVQVPEGDHTITVRKSGFKDWQRKMKVSAGNNVHLNAELETIASPSASMSTSEGNVATLASQVNVNQTPTSSLAVAKVDDDSASASPRSTIGAFADGNPEIRHDGVTLTAVTPGGPADQAGIKAGDVILAINDHYLFTIRELQEEINHHEPGKKLTVRYRRYSAINDASIVVGRVQ